MMKHSLKTTLLLLALATTLDATADYICETIDEIIYTCFYSGYGADAVGDYAVVSSADSLVSGAHHINSSVTWEYTYLSYFDGYPIYVNRNLTAPVTRIGNWALSQCDKLTSIYIPNSVTTIGEGAFYDCTSLTSVNIPNSITAIKTRTFQHCSSLTSITIPNSVTAIGLNAFCGCSNLTSATIPNSVTTIDEGAFYDCTSLTSVNISESVKSIGIRAFGDCTSLKSMIVQSGNTVYDSRNNCNAIIKTASNTLISGCQNTIIPNSVTSIGNYAFYQCKSLTNVNIPNSVTSIGDWAFFGCSSLTSVTCLAETPPTALYKSFSEYYDYDTGHDVFTSATLYVPAGSLYEYQTTEPWKNFQSILPIGEEYSLTMDVSNLVMEKGEVFHLKATVTPDDDNAPSVTWSSSNNNVASVNDMGFVTAVGTGTATITARAGDAYATCQVSVVEHTVTLDQSSVTIQNLSTVQLHATVTPDDEYAPTIEWSSSHPGIASATQSGLVKGYMPGTATITAKAGLSTATCVVTVTPIYATDIALNSYQEEMEVGDIYRLVATVYPSNVSNGNVSWSIPQNDVISCTWNGNECLISAEKTGTVTVTATTTDGTNLSASCVITVKGSAPSIILAQSITLDNSSIKLVEGKVKQLYATVLPANTTNKKVSWSSSNTAVATVTSHGVVKGIMPGIATITATTTDGTDLSDTCKVTVISDGGGDDDILRGDVNGDGKLSIDDVTALINYLLNGDVTDINMDNADVDGDGRINIDDVTALINKLLNGN